MTNATSTPVETVPATPKGTDSESLVILASGERPEYAPGRVNSGRQASFDAVSAWNAVGRID